MINGALLRKTLHEALWLWLTCAAVLFAFCWLHVVITGQVDMGRFEALLDNLPPQWEKFSPVPFKQLISYPARIAVIYEEPLVYLMMAIWCIARSSDAVSGELGRGTLEMLLAQPVSRLQVLLIPVGVAVSGMALLALVAWAGTCAGIATTSIERPAPGSSWTIPFTEIWLPIERADAQQQRIPMRRLAAYRLFLPAVLNYFSLGFFLLGVGTLISALDRYRWRAIGITTGLYVVQMLGEFVGQALESLSWARQTTVFRAYEPVRFVSAATSRPELGWSWVLTDASGAFVELGPLACDTILLTLGLASLVAAAIVFCRRDLPAPL